MNSFLFYQAIGDKIILMSFNNKPISYFTLFPEIWFIKIESLSWIQNIFIYSKYCATYIKISSKSENTYLKSTMHNLSIQNIETESVNIFTKRVFIFLQRCVFKSLFKFSFWMGPQILCTSDSTLQLIR